MASARDKILTFVRSALFYKRTSGPCSRIELRQCESGEPNRSLGLWEVSEEVDPNELAGTIYELAEQDAEVSTRPSQYVVVAYFGKCKVFEASSPRILIRSVNENGEWALMGGQVDESEPATAKGLLAQLMRHVEANNRTFVGSFAQVLGAQQHTIDRLSQLHETDLDKRLEMVQAIESLVSRKHEREVETMAAARSEETKAELARQFMPLIPSVVNRLGGKKLLPETVDPALESMIGVLASMRPEQIEAVLGALDPPQAAAMLSFYESAVKPRKRERKESRSDNGQSE